MAKLRPRRTRGIVVAGIVFAVAASALGARPPRMLRALEARVFDTFLRSTHRPPGAAGPVIVDIDEASLARHGQWPWPRYRVAALLEAVRALGADAVGIDVIFPEPDRTSLALLAREVERDLGVAVPLDEAAAARTDNDRTLAAELAKGPFVLGYSFTFEGERPSPGCTLRPLRWPGGGAPGRGFFEAGGVVCNTPALDRAGGGSGFINVAPDEDGTIRRAPLLVRYAGQVYPSLALACIERARPEWAPALRAGPGGATELLLGGRPVPIDARGNLLLNYRGGRGSFEHLSAADVLDGRVPAGALKGRIAIIGTAAAGLKDLRPTPLDAALPGPEIHATVIDNLLSPDFLSRPFAVRGIELAAALLLGVLAALLLARARAAWALPSLGAGSAALWVGAYLLFARTGIFASPVVPQLVLAGSFTLLLSLRFVQSERAAADFSRKLALTQDVIIQSMAALAETRDNETGGHIQRTRHYVRLLAERLRAHPRFAAFLDEWTIELLFKLAPLHDIGKVGVRDHVLLKPERLTPSEFEEMKRHTVFGDNTLELAERHLGDDSFLRIAREFALTHQEKWDGSGYPQGLRGDEIPIAGRLMAVADVYDALVSRRKYKEPMPHEEAAAIILQGRGTHFDPDIVDAFIANQGEFRAIAERFADGWIAPAG